MLLLLVMPMGIYMCMKRQALNIKKNVFYFLIFIFHVLHIMIVLLPSIFRARMVLVILHSLLSKIKPNFQLHIHVTARYWSQCFINLLDMILFSPPFSFFFFLNLHLRVYTLWKQLTVVLSLVRLCSSFLNLILLYVWLCIVLFKVG